MRNLILGVVAVMVVAGLVGPATVAYAEEIHTNTVTGLTIISPTTLSPASVLPGGTVDITYQITVNKLDEVVDRQVSILTTPEITVNPPVIPTPLPAYTFTVTTTVTVPVGTAPGTYNVRVRARQPAAGGWQQVANMPNAVIVLSPVPPLSITAPPDIIFEGNTIGGATGVPLGTPTVSGGTPPYTITNNAPTFFPLGVTIVTWTVTDALGNTASDTQKVTVVDTTPPTITVVSTVTVIVGAPSTVLPPPTVSDIVDPNPTVTNDAPAYFPLGVTTVTWTATDASGNSATATTKVTAIYGFLGLLPPYGASGKPFKLGSGIPIKWQYTDYFGSVIDSSSAAPYVEVRLVTPLTGEGEPLPVEDPGKSGLQYDPVTFTWQFNWQTKGLSAGTYAIYIISRPTGQRNGPFYIQLK